MKLKKMLSLLAAAAMAVTALTVSMSMSVVNAADEYVTSGTWGKDGRWVISEDGTLTVTGTGELGSHALIPTPSRGIAKFVNRLVVGEGITQIDTQFTGSEIVQHNSTEIILPSTLSGETSFNFRSSVKKDVYIYSKNVTWAEPNKGALPSPGNAVFHVYKDSDTEKCLRSFYDYTDEDIVYIEGERPQEPEPVPAEVAPLTETSGPSGLTTKWEWNETSKTLTFSGKGSISIADDYKKYAESTEHIVIESGITSISTADDSQDGTSSAYKGAFAGFTALKDVKLPDTLVKIGSFSFYKTTSLTKFDLPSNIEYIGYNAFRESSIEEISFPDSLNEIGEGAFSDCTKLKSINLHEGMNIWGGAFCRCESLKELTIPKNIYFSPICTGGAGLAREAFTFSPCTGLEKVTIEGGGTTEAAFGVQHENSFAAGLCSGCTSLKTVIIKGNVDTIFSYSFRVCPSLEDIYFYNTGLTTIAEKGYGNNGNLESIDTSNNPTFHVVKGSTTEQTLRDAGYLTDENTEYITDTSALEAAITEAEEIDTSKYTDETVAALATAVENGKALLENESATQEVVDQAVTAVKDAISALKEKVEEPTDEPPTDEPPTDEPTEPETQEPTTEPADVTVSVIPDKAYAMPGDEVTYTIHVDTKKVPLYTVQMRLVIPEGMTYVENSGAIVDGVQEKLGYDNVAWTEQSLIINGYASAPKSVDSFDLATFKCKVDEGLADGTELAMDLTYLEFTEEGFAKIANVAVAAGVVTVGEDPNPTEPSTEPTSDDTTQAPTNGGSTTTPTDKPAGNNNNNNNNNGNNGGANGTGTSATDKPVNTGAPAAVGLSAFLAAAAIGIVAMKKKNR